MLFKQAFKLKQPIIDVKLLKDAVAEKFHPIL
jgi:hypothetical protein